jgi:hypothetical protein
MKMQSLAEWKGFIRKNENSGGFSAQPQILLLPVASLRENQGEIPWWWRRIL